MNMFKLDPRLRGDDNKKCGDDNTASVGDNIANGDVI